MARLPLRESPQLVVLRNAVVPLIDGALLIVVYHPRKKALRPWVGGVMDEEVVRRDNLGGQHVAPFRPPPYFLSVLFQIGSYVIQFPTHSTPLRQWICGDVLVCYRSE